MAIQTTASPTISSIIARYGESYIKGTKLPRVYDQFAVDYTKFLPGMSMEEIMRSSSVYVPFKSGMAIGTSTLSQTTDLTPQVRYDATVTVTPTSRGEALQWSQPLEFTAFSEFTASAYEDIGENIMETIEAVCVDTALAGTWYSRYTAARSSMDAGTSAHRLSEAQFRYADGLFQSVRVPGYAGEGGPQWAAVGHPWPFHDLMEDTKIVALAEYQKAGILLNWELGMLGRFKLVSTPYAKVYMGAGANYDTDVDTSVGTATTPLDTTLVTADDVSSNVAKGELWTVGTIETSTTFYPMNERFVPLSASTYTITLNGTEQNGGLKYAHAAGEDVIANDSVYPILFAGPESLVRLYATNPAANDPEAQAFAGVPGAAVVGPKRSGLANQWNSLAWKWWGGYGLVSEHRLFRLEVSTSYEHST